MRAIKAMVFGFAALVGAAVFATPVWTSGDFNPAEWTPAEDNILRYDGVKGEFSPNWVHYVRGGVDISQDIATLTDGDMPRKNGGDFDYTKIVGVGKSSNETMIWTWETPIRELAEIRVYTRWYGGTRDDLKIASDPISVMDAEGNWKSIGAASCVRVTSSCSAYAFLTDPEDGILAENIYGIRLRLSSSQENDGAGYAEVEAIERKVAFDYGIGSCVCSAGEIEYHEANDVHYYTYSAAGTFTALVDLELMDNEGETLGYLREGDTYAIASASSFSAAEIDLSDVPLAEVASVEGSYAEKDYFGATIYSFTDTENGATVTFSKPGKVDLMMIGGGGAGGFMIGGGGGAGEYRRNRDQLVFAGVPYPVTIGAGGVSATANNLRSGNGGDTVFGPLVAIGGGAGGSWQHGSSVGMGFDGGSGGGAGSSSHIAGIGGSGIGGDGGRWNVNEPGYPGKDGTGSGGGGGCLAQEYAKGGRGGSGIVVLRVGMIDSTDPAPSGSDGRLDSVTSTTATFSGLVAGLGVEAVDCDIVLAYGFSAGNLAYSQIIGTVSETGEFSFTADGLRPDSRYYAKLLLDNGAEEPVAISGVFHFVTLPEGAEPGFVMGHDTTSTANATFDIYAYLEGTTDQPYTIHLADERPWPITLTDGTETTTAWQGKSRYGYDTMMYFEDETYTFAENMDDCAIVVIDGETVLFGGGNTTALAPVAIATYKPDGAGWHSVQLYAIDGGGGYGPCGGFIGIGWSTDSGKTYHKFINDGGYPLFVRPWGETFATVESAVNAGETATFAVRFDAAVANGTAAIYWADEYAGTGTEGWTKLGEEELDGESAHTFTFEVPDGAKYLRFVATDGEAMSETTAIPFAEAKVVDASVAVAEYLSMGAIDSISAVINGNVISCGDEATTAVTVRFGLSADDLESSVTFDEFFSEGTMSVRLTGLTPHRTYYAALYAGDAGTEMPDDCEIFTFATAARPSDAADPFAGLYQTLNGGETFRTLGALAVDTPTTWTDVTGETVFGWGNSYTYVYTGYIYLYNTEYQVFGYVDNAGLLKINNNILYNSGSRENRAYTPENGEGWYPIRIEAVNIDGGAGPWNGIIGMGFNTNGNTHVSQTEAWTRFLDPGDGSLLRTTPGVRNGTVARHVVNDDQLTATLSLGGWQSADTVSLKIAYGANIGGGAITEWDGVMSVRDDVTIDMTELTVTTLAGAGTDYRYARFFFADGENWQWCGPSLYLPDPTRPKLEDVAVDGVMGDAITVTGKAAEVGAGETARLMVYVSANQDMSDAIEWEGPECVEGEPFTFTLWGEKESKKYIVPGNRYFVRVELVGEGDFKDVDPVFDVTTPAAASFGTHTYKGVYVWGGNFPIEFFDVGAGGKAFVSVYAGNSADRTTMSKVAEAVVTEAGKTVNIYAEFALDQTIYYAYCVSNACMSGSWVRWAESPSYVIQFTDSFTYRWKGDVTEGNWKDPANWTADNDDLANPHHTYPHTGNNAVFIGCDDTNETLRITIDGYYDCRYNNISFTTPGAKVEFVGNGDWNTSWLRTGSIGFADGMDFTVRDMRLDVNGHQFANGLHVTYDHALGYFSTRTRMNGENNELTLKNGSFFYHYTNGGASHIIAGGKAPHITINDSRMQFDGYAIEQSALGDGDWKGLSIDFYGTNAFYQSSGIIKVLGEGWTDDSLPEFIFHVPEGGYTNEVAATAVDSLTKSLDGTAAPLKLTVAKDSPAKKGGKLLTKLVDFHDSGLAEESILFGLMRTNAQIYFDDETAPTAVWCQFGGSGLRVYIR